MHEHIFTIAPIEEHERAFKYYVAASKYGWMGISAIKCIRDLRSLSRCGFTTVFDTTAFSKFKVDYAEDALQDALARRRFDIVAHWGCERSAYMVRYTHTHPLKLGRMLAGDASVLQAFARRSRTVVNQTRSSAVEPRQLRLAWQSRAR